jgi:hypothetical protein
MSPTGASAKFPPDEFAYFFGGNAGRWRRFLAFAAATRETAAASLADFANLPPKIRHELAKMAKTEVHTEGRRNRATEE